MKKEILAGAILIAIFAAMLVNVHFLGKTSYRLINEIDRAETLALTNNWNSAESAAREALRHWDALRSYTHITVRHGEIDSTTEAFSSFIGSVLAQDDAGIKCNALILRQKLSSIYKMERLTFGSIF